MSRAVAARLEEPSGRTLLPPSRSGRNDRSCNNRKAWPPHLFTHAIRRLFGAVGWTEQRSNSGCSVALDYRHETRRTANHRRRAESGRRRAARGRGLRAVRARRPVFDAPNEDAAARSGGSGRGDSGGRSSRGPRHAARRGHADFDRLRKDAAADAWDVCAASLKRTEQSLRSLEEYGKLVDARVCRPVRVDSLSALHAGKGDRRRSDEPRAAGRRAAVRAGRWPRFGGRV